MKKLHYTNTQSRFAEVVFDSVLGTPDLESHTPDGVLVGPCQLKKPFKGRVQDPDKGVAGRKEREQLPPK